MRNEVNISVKELFSFCNKILINAGIPTEEAKVISDSLVDANVMGIVSHGVTRFDYIARLERGVIKEILN